METIIEFGKMLIPAGIVMYAMFLMVKTLLNKELEKKILDVKGKSKETILPMRLQAYERMCLLLERLSPDNLIIRINTPQLTAVEFHHILIEEVNNEFNHNLSQQVYMSVEAWEMIKNAKADIIASVNLGFEGMNENSSSLELAKAIIQNYLGKSPDPIQHALNFVKREIQEEF